MKYKDISANQIMFLNTLVSYLKVTYMGKLHKSIFMSDEEYGDINKLIDFINKIIKSKKYSESDTVILNNLSEYYIRVLKEKKLNSLLNAHGYTLDDIHINRLINIAENNGSKLEFVRYLKQECNINIMLKIAKVNIADEYYKYIKK